MLACSSVGHTGDEVVLLSAPVTLTSSRLLNFYYYMKLSSADTTAALTVYQYSPLHVYTQTLGQVTGDRGATWHEAAVCLPAGAYRLAFVATIGLSYLSDIAIDDVTLDQSCSFDIKHTDIVNGMYGDYLNGELA